MSRSVFVSYNHRQADWVHDRLVPVLKAGGAEVLVDHERFTAGKAVVGQMDATQDAAEVHLLVLSPDYVASDYCVHEMERAVARDPNFEDGVVVPVRRVDVDLPELIRRGEPLYANLVDEALLERALSRAVVRGNNVLIELLEKESRLPGEWDYLQAFRGVEEQDVPEDEAVARSLRRRRLVEEDGGRFRLRVPLMARWLRERI